LIIKTRFSSESIQNVSQTLRQLKEMQEADVYCQDVEKIRKLME
jgi:uncharacterized protein YoaH (UPF0181 family)